MKSAAKAQAGASHRELELLSEDGWTVAASGEDWVVPAYQAIAVRVTEIGTRLFSALRLDVSIDVARDFRLSGIVLDDRLVLGRDGVPDHQATQPFGRWIDVRRRRPDRPLILEIDNRCERGRRFCSTLSIRDGDGGAIWRTPLG